MSFDMAPPDGAINLQAVVAVLPELGYAEHFFRTVRAALNKSAKIYKRPLDRIPACRIVFDENWRGVHDYARFGFTTQRKYRDWLSTMRGALDRFERHRMSGDWRGERYADDWPALAGFLKADAPKLGLCTCRAWMQFNTFIAVAREDGVAPARVDSAWVARADARLDYERRKSFLRGLDAFNALVSSDAAHAALPGLLPVAPATPPPRRAPRRPYAGFLPAEIPETVRCDFVAWIDRRRNGASEDRLSDEDDKTKFVDKSAEAYGYAVGWLWRTLVSAERLDPDEVVDLADLLTYRNIFDAARLFQELRADPASGLKPDAGSLHSYVSKTTLIAMEHCGVSAVDREKMRKLRRKPLVRTPSVAQMARDRKKWLVALADDERQQRRLIKLPELLMSLSKTILDRWDEHCGLGSQSLRMRGLKLGVAAMQAAILFYGKPVRAANLRWLRIWCDAQTLAVPQGREPMRLSIPGEQTKNRASIEGDIDPEALPILHFYLSAVRPRMISQHPYGKAYADSEFLFCSPQLDAPMEHSVFAAAFSEAMDAAGLEITLHMARHASVFFLLDEDPNAWAEASELLDIDELTVRKFYAFICKRKAHQSARAKLRRSRAKRLRGAV